MEYFDILDRQGNPIGQTAPKGSPLLPGQYYLGTHVYVHNASAEFLIQQRALHKKFLPGGWDICAEHTIAGESSAECAKRGLLEEIGLDVPDKNLRLVLRLVREELSHITDVYFAQIDFDLAQLILAQDEVIGVKAISHGEMLELIASMVYRPKEYRRHITNTVQKLTQA